MRQKAEYEDAKTRRCQDTKAQEALKLASPVHLSTTEQLTITRMGRGLLRLGTHHS